MRPETCSAWANTRCPGESCLGALRAGHLAGRRNGFGATLVAPRNLIAARLWRRAGRWAILSLS
jgi:hypothetical protein